MSGKGGIPRENTPRSARMWSKDEPRHKVALIVSCRNRRILAAALGDPARLTFTYRGTSSLHLLDGVRFTPDRSTGNPSGQVGPTRLIFCPNHAEGHLIDGAKLREVLDRLGRHARPRYVDVGDVV